MMMMMMTKKPTMVVKNYCSAALRVYATFCIVIFCVSATKHGQYYDVEYSVNLNLKHEVSRPLYVCKVRSLSWPDVKGNLSTFCVSLRCSASFYVSYVSGAKRNR